jgi:hypothetical protein
MSRTPKEFVEMKNVTAVFMGDDEIVILGTPDEEVNEEHNCDYMGCSSVEHVIFRAKFVNGSARIG